MRTPKSNARSLHHRQRAAPAPFGDAHRPAAEHIAKEAAFEAMKRLIRCGGDTAGLSDLDRAALAWAQAVPDERHPEAPPGGRAPRFVSNTDDRVWATVPILKARGWTAAAIRDFLPEPDGLKPNPRFSERGRPMRVWLAATVAEAEATEEWGEWLRKSLRRRGTTTQELKERTEGDFRRRVEAVQAAIEAHLRDRIARSPKEVAPAA